MEKKVEIILVPSVSINPLNAIHTTVGQWMNLNVFITYINKLYWSEILHSELRKCIELDIEKYKFYRPCKWTSDVFQKKLDSLFMLLLILVELKAQY